MTNFDEVNLEEVDANLGYLLINFILGKYLKLLLPLELELQIKIQK